MAYLDGTSITIDAILTKKGRELLASGKNNFNVTSFALADDEIDYDLWNPNHTLGANYYGQAIEAMPILEANPDESIAMKYLLVSLDLNTVAVPYLSIAYLNAVMGYGEAASIVPTTRNYGSQLESYKATLDNSTYFSLNTATGKADDPHPSGQSTTVMGTSFNLICKNNTSVSHSCTITIWGVNSGATATIYAQGIPYVAELYGPPVGR